MPRAEEVTLIVDGANVMGSRPDGWWRDRAGAITRLHGELAALAARGALSVPPDEEAAGGTRGEHVPGVAGETARGTRGEHVPGAAGEAGPGRGAGTLAPRIVLVVEGRAKAALRDMRDAPGVRVVGAPGEGDDEIAALAGSVSGRRFVITADRELSGRCRAAGAGVLGPRWLLARFAE